MKLEDRFLYSGGTDSLENFPAECSASAPVVYKHPPLIGPEMLYTTGAGEGDESVRGDFSLQRWWCIKSCLRKKECVNNAHKAPFQVRRGKAP